MEQWRKISLAGILLGNISLLVDYFFISIPYAIMIPILLIAVVLIFAGLIMRKKQTKGSLSKNIIFRHPLGCRFCIFAVFMIQAAVRTIRRDSSRS